MKIMTFAFCLAFAATTQAATHEHGQPHHPTVQTVAPHSGVGVLKAINSKDGKLQIAHEPITDLGWPSMTMWFAMRIPVPHDLKAGDSVQFEIQQNDNKQWAITRIRRK